jgi:hypothetical protein
MASVPSHPAIAFFLENNRDLAVKNGMLGTVGAVEQDAIQMRLDGAASGQNNAGVLSLPVIAMR